MSSTVSYWILSSARKTIATLQGGQRLYSRYASNRSKSKWRLCPQGQATLKDNAAACGGIALQKAYRHTSTEEEDFHLQLSPEQVNEVLFHGKDPALAVSELMLRDRKNEITDAEWDNTI